MQSRPELRTAGLVLAAGGSRRLGRPKQLLPYGDGVMLEAVMAAARSCGFDQLVMTLGGSADAVLSAIDTTDFDIVENPGFGDGCSSSIASAVPALHPETDVLVLLLGDQPGMQPSSVRLLLDGRGESPLAVCRYDDGIGHPFAFHRSVLPTLAALHGDKGVWKLLDQRARDVSEVRVPGRIPLDVDTEADYELVLAELRNRA